MSTTTRLTFQEFEQLPEQEGIRYELDEGELLMEPSPTFRHNLIRDRIARWLFEFVKTQGVGSVTVEMDFRLAPDTVRNPDVAYITLEHFQKINLDSSPVDGAPALAIEVVSPSNLAQDMAKKVGQHQIGITLVLGIPAAIAAGKLMTNQLFAVQPWDPIMLALAALMLSLAALLASAIPARRAAGVEPMVALRNE